MTLADPHFFFAPLVLPGSVRCRVRFNPLPLSADGPRHMGVRAWSQVGRLAEGDSPLADLVGQNVSWPYQLISEQITSRGDAASLVSGTLIAIPSGFGARRPRPRVRPRRRPYREALPWQSPAIPCRSARALVSGLLPPPSAARHRQARALLHWQSLTLHVHPHPHAPHAHPLAGAVIAITAGGGNALVGVAIAAALLPPLVNCGLCWGLAFRWQWQDPDANWARDLLEIAERILSGADSVRGVRGGGDALADGATGGLDYTGVSDVAQAQVQAALARPLGSTTTTLGSQPVDAALQPVQPASVDLLDAMADVQPKLAQVNGSSSTTIRVKNVDIDV